MTLLYRRATVRFSRTFGKYLHEVVAGRLDYGAKVYILGQAGRVALPIFRRAAKRGQKEGKRRYFWARLFAFYIKHEKPDIIYIKFVRQRFLIALPS